MLTTAPPESVTTQPVVVPLPENPTPVVYTAAAPVYMLDEANFLRLKSPGPLRTKVAPGALGAGLTLALAVITDYVRTRERPDARLDPYGLAVAVGLLLVGVAFWVLGTVAPSERAKVVKKIEAYFTQHRRDL